MGGWSPIARTHSAASRPAARSGPAWLWMALTMLVLSVFAASGLKAQDLEVHVSADSVTVGQRFVLSVTARHDFAAAPRYPAPDSAGSLQFGDIEVLQILAREESNTASGRTDSIAFEVTTFALDTARVAAIPILFTAGEDTFTVETEPTWLPVVSLVPEDAEDVKDLAPLVEFPAPIWPYIAGALALLLLAALAALYVRRRRQATPTVAAPPTPSVPPDEEAFTRIDALEAVDLSVREHVQPFYDELSATLRTYVARRLDVHAMEMTTGEVVRSLQRRPIPDDETTAKLRNILVSSDYVKFADATPPPAEGKAHLSTARKIVHRTEELIHPEETEPDDEPTLQ